MRMTCNDQLAATIRALLPAGLCAITAAAAAALAVPSAARAETAKALPASAASGGRAAIALPAPGPLVALAARPGQRSYSLPAVAAPRFGPSAGALAEGGQALRRFAAAAPAQPLRAAIPQFRVEADDGTLTSTWHHDGYDLRLEYGTALYRAPTIAGREGPLVATRTRLMSRVVTRF